MRGTETKQATMLSWRSPEQRVPKDHPRRAIKRLADEALVARSPTVDAMYSRIGRPSVPPERLLKATVLWFLDMHMMEPSFDHRVFSVNRQRPLAHDVTGQFFAQAQAARLMSAEHVTVDGTLIEAWASLKRVRPKGEPPEARLARKGKGKEAKLAYGAHALVEHRHGLLVDLHVTSATDTTEPDAALALLDAAGAGERRVTGSGDKGYDTRGFVDGQPAVPQAGGRDLRLDEDRRGLPPDARHGPGPDAASRLPGGAAYIHPAAHGAAAARDGVTGQGSVRMPPHGPLAGARPAPQPSSRGEAMTRHDSIGLHSRFSTPC